MISFFLNNKALIPEIMNNGTAGKNITAKYNLPFKRAVPITSLKNGNTVTKIELNAERLTAIINLELLKGKRIYVQFFYTQESDIRRQFYQKISKWRVE